LFSLPLSEEVFMQFTKLDIGLQTLALNDDRDT
jgi:hypothetical protein